MVCLDKKDWECKKLVNCYNGYLKLIRKLGIFSLGYVM